VCDSAPTSNGKLTLETYSMLLQRASICFCNNLYGSTSNLCGSAYGEMAEYQADRTYTVWKWKSRQANAIRRAQGPESTPHPLHKLLNSRYEGERRQ
jgi:hypothetical protein